MRRIVSTPYLSLPLLYSYRSEIGRAFRRLAVSVQRPAFGVLCALDLYPYRYLYL